MVAQYLTGPSAQQSVMNSLFTAFAGFTAFGSAIVAVLTSGGAVQKVADRLGRHAPERNRWVFDLLTIGPFTVLICLVALGSGTGLLLSFLWLHAAGSDGWSWAYRVSVDLFEFEVGCMTLVTFAAVLAAALTAVMSAKGIRARRVNAVEVNPVVADAERGHGPEQDSEVLQASGAFGVAR